MNRLTNFLGWGMILIMCLVCVNNYLVGKYTEKTIAKQTKEINTQLNNFRLEVNARSAEVKYIQNIILQINKELELEAAYLYAVEIVNAAEMYKNIHPILLTAVIYRESRFDPNAISPAGAKGLMQIMPETAVWICGEWGIPYNDSLVFNPFINIRMGAWYLTWLYTFPNVCKYDLELTLAYYNGGGRQAYRYNEYRKGNGKTDSLSIGLSEETKNYVKSVMSKYNTHKKQI